MNHEIAYIRQAYKTHFLTEHYCINFWRSASSSDATFCTAWYNRLLIVLYFIFIKNLLFLQQNVSWTAHPKYNTHSVAASNDFVAKIFLKVLLRTYSKDLIWDLFIWFIPLLHTRIFIAYWVRGVYFACCSTDMTSEFSHLLVDCYA